MLVVGLTGGIASGKSTVSRLLSAKHHIPIIDADVLSRTVILPGTRGYRNLVRHFGPRILLPDGETIDRAALGEIVFNDERERKVLSGIVHPEVRKAMVWGVVRAWLRGEWVVILDVPLLIETGIYKLVGKIVVVYVPESLQIARLKARPLPSPSDPPLTSTQAISRIRAQAPLSSKLPYADHVLDNSSDPAELERQVDMLVNRWASGSARGPTGWRTWVERIPPIGIVVGAWTIFRRIVIGKGEKKKARRKTRGERSGGAVPVTGGGERIEMRDFSTGGSGT